MIKPHGGKLVKRVVVGQKREELIAQADLMSKLYLDFEKLNTVENIATGLFSPLSGFMTKKDYDNVLEKMCLANGTIWTIPVVLAVSKQEAKDLQIGEKIALHYKKDRELYAILELSDIFTYDKNKEADLVYKTRDKAHPGVANLYQRDNILLGGNINLLKKIKYQDFRKYRKTPEETRKIIKEKGWKTIVAFQTRNPIHRAHEYLQKCALEMVDGLFLSPLVGKTKASDIPADIRIKSYELVLKKLYPQTRTMMVVFPAAMRYAGPREAIFHALCRKNYGCTHFIVGRDHAGVGDYYGTYEAQNIFEQFPKEKLAIIPLKFDYAFYCKKCASMASGKTCPHSQENHIFLSGTKVRELLSNGQRPPKEMTRVEVADILIKGLKKGEK